MTDTAEATIQPYAYRTDEGEFIDIKDPATEKWMTDLYPAVMNARKKVVTVSSTNLV